jgi:hypothetical protein
MPPRFFVTLLCAAGVLLLAGCENMRSPARFEPLPSIENYNPAIRAKIRSGILEIGYTQEMVMLTIGPPDIKGLNVAPNGQLETWTYYTYYRRTGKEAERSYPFERRVSYEPPLRAYRVFDLPSVTPTEEQDRSERIRLVFRQGRLMAIEQIKGQ